MKNLREYRKRARMSANELAKAAGITITSVYRYEYGTREPSVEIAARIAKVLGCTVEDLIDEKGEKTA